MVLYSILFAFILAGGVHLSQGEEVPRQSLGGSGPRVPVVPLDGGEVERSKSDIRDARDKAVIRTSCTSNAMSFSLKESYFTDARIPVQELYLSTKSAACRPNRITDVDTGTGNSRKKLELDWGLSSCGTKVSDDGENTVYSNTLSQHHPGSTVVVDYDDHSFILKCSIPNKQAKTTSIEGALEPRRDFRYVQDQAFGEYELRLQIVDAGFVNPVKVWPHEVKVNDDLHLRLHVHTTGDNLELYAERCWATPEQDPTSQPQYDLIVKDCQVDAAGVGVVPTKNTEVLFQFQAFKFLGPKYPNVYIHCNSRVCHSSDTDNICLRGCQPKRRRRQASTNSTVGEASELDIVTNGPIRRGSGSSSAFQQVSVLSLVSTCVMAFLFAKP